MQNGNLKLQDLFNGDRIFNVPKYQRAYAWDEDNLESFYDDLKNQRGSKSYFLGTLLFHQQKNRGEYEFLDIVDGQQRLATIIIFIKETLRCLQNKKSNSITKKTHARYIFDGYAYKIELENEDSSYLHDYILEDNPLNGIKIETAAQRNLLNAKKYFQKNLKDLTLKTLERIFDVMKNSDVILYVVNNISDATQIFELLNDRGRRLTKLEGIKSFLMYRIGCLKLRNSDQPIDDIQDSFSRIYRIAEASKINEDDVIRYHTIAFEKSKTDDYDKPVKFIKDKINLFFNKNVEDLKIKNEIISYVSKLKTSFNLCKEIDTNEYKYAELDKLFMIGRIYPFYPLLMHLKQSNPDSFKDFVSDLIRFTFRASLIGLRNDNEGFYKYIREDRDYCDLFKWIIDDNWWNINTRVEEVIDYDNYYGWLSTNIVRYILFSYENHLREKKGHSLLTVENYFSKSKREKLSIEHITAQRSKASFSDSFKENYLHSIGNLVIDTVSSNSGKGKKEVAVKLKEYRGAPLMSQNEVNEYKINWNKVKDVKIFIRKRDVILKDFIRSHLLK